MERKNSLIEEWREIQGYDGRYQISNFGRIRSMPYVNYQPSSHPGIMMEKHIPGKIMAPTNNGNGYMIIALRYKGSKKKNHYVHRLVAEAFIPNPDGFAEVNHIDYDKGNNIATNLEWVSRKQNIAWSKDNMRKPTPNARKTNLGLRYISMRNGKYRFSIHNKIHGFCFDKCYETLEEAVEAKEQFIYGKKYFATK